MLMYFGSDLFLYPAFYGRTQHPAFLQGTAMASLLGQLPTWIAVTVSTWVACWIFVAPQKCQDVAVFGSSKSKGFMLFHQFLMWRAVFLEKLTDLPDSLC